MAVSIIIPGDTGFASGGGGAGTVVGPGSSTDNAIVRWDGTTGALVQNSPVTIDDSGFVTMPTSGKLIMGSSGIVKFPSGSYIDDGANVHSVDPAARFLQDSLGRVVLSWDETSLIDPGTFAYTMNWAGYQGYDSGGITSYDWNARSLYNTDGVAVVQWQSQFLNDRAGSIVVSWDESTLFNNGAATLSWNFCELHDTSDNSSIRWGSRTMQDVSGADLVDYTGTINASLAMSFSSSANGACFRNIVDDEGTVSIIPNDRLLKAGSGTTILDWSSLQNAQNSLLSNQLGAEYKLLSSTGTNAFWAWAPTVINLVAGINGKTVATTNLFTVPSAKTLIVTGVTVECTAASAITVGPTLGIGVAAGEDDVFPSTALTTLTVTTKFYSFNTTGMQIKVAAGSVLKIGIDAGATGTSQTLRVSLLGYLL